MLLYVNHILMHAVRRAWFAIWLIGYVKQVIHSSFMS